LRMWLRMWLHMWSRGVVILSFQGPMMHPIRAILAFGAGFRPKCQAMSHIYRSCTQSNRLKSGARARYCPLSYFPIWAMEKIRHN
ncbi:hypothetical protein F4815DRAFT_468046, partial [Daldinia loculata]